MTNTSLGRPIFPFSAVVGQTTLKTALLLNCIDNKIGGVLISGSRGSAKSTLARGLSDFLPSKSHLVNLPLGASEEQLIGSLDINSALNDKQFIFKPGMLHKAHQGVLYIDEVNLLPDHLIDSLLDAAASGINYIERDGFSQQHAAEFVLIGTMNPDEGLLRPQLLDRFGLSVAIEAQSDPSERIQIMENRLEFENNPELFRNKHQTFLRQTTELIQRARERLPQVQVSDAIKLKIATACIEANVDGLRADIVWLRAAKAYAALNGSNNVSDDDVESVRPLVLHHREQAPQTPQSHQSPNAKAPADSPSSKPDSLAEKSKPSHLNQMNEAQGQWGEMPNESIVSEPIDTVNTVAIKSLLDFSTTSASRLKPFNTASDYLLAQKQKGQNDNSPKSGHFKHPNKPIDWYKTFINHKNLCADSTEHLLPVLKKSSKQQSRLHIILLDTSASTMFKNVLAKAKSLVIMISQQAYLAREQLAVLSFGNQKCQWLINPQRAPKDCHQLLDLSPSGGGTPLRQALLTAQQLLHKTTIANPLLSIQTYLLSDGRSNESFADINWKTPLMVIDMEAQAVPIGRAQQIASQLNARYQHMNHFMQYSPNN